VHAVPSPKSVPCRAALLAAFLVACSDGAGTLAPDPGSYNPVASGGANGASTAGHGGLPPVSNGASAGQPAALGTGGSGFGAAGTLGSASGPTSGSSGSTAGGATGGVASVSFGGGVSTTSTFGGASSGAGRGGAASGGSAGSLAGHGGALTQGSAGKQGAAGAPANVPATFSAVSSIIQANCSICHGMRAPRLTNSANLYTTLTSTVVKECGGNPLVKPNDPANSALIMLPNWECNDLVMPQGCVNAPCLTDSELATITAWINAGAPSK